MKVKDIIKIACDFTCNEEIANKLNESEPSLTQNQQKTVNNLVKYLNYIQNEIACEYLPLTAYDEVKTQDFKVFYSSLSKTPIAIVGVKDKFNRTIRFKAFSDYLMAYAANVRIKYNFLPDEISSIEQELTQPLVPMRIYAYGIAREYFLQQSLSDDADIFEQRFKDSLQSFSRKKSETVLPKRRWL